MKILIFEDDKFLVRMYSKKFEKAGHTVMFSESGVDALKSAKDLKPDVVVTDMIMPEKDGNHVLSELQSDPETKKIPVIVLTNLTQNEDVKRFKSLGATKCLSKGDTSFEDVVKAVESFSG